MNPSILSRPLGRLYSSTTHHLGSFLFRPRVLSSMAVATSTPRDPNTLSNYHHWRSTHISATFDILFDQKKLVGNVVHQFRSTTEAQSREIILDTSYLDIGEVKVNGQQSQWEWMPAVAPYGTPLKIVLEKPVELDGTVEVDVRSSCLSFSLFGTCLVAPVLRARGAGETRNDGAPPLLESTAKIIMARLRFKRPTSVPRCSG